MQTRKTYDTSATLVSAKATVQYSFQRLSLNKKCVSIRFVLINRTNMGERALFHLENCQNTVRAARCLPAGSTFAAYDAFLQLFLPRYVGYHESIFVKKGCQFQAKSTMNCYKCWESNFNVSGLMVMIPWGQKMVPCVFTVSVQQDSGQKSCCYREFCTIVSFQCYEWHCQSIRHSSYSLGIWKTVAHPDQFITATRSSHGNEGYEVGTKWGNKIGCIVEVCNSLRVKCMGYRRGWQKRRERSINKQREANRELDQIVFGDRCKRKTSFSFFLRLEIKPFWFCWQD